MEGRATLTMKKSRTIMNTPAMSTGRTRHGIEGVEGVEGVEGGGVGRVGRDEAEGAGRAGLEVRVPVKFSSVSMRSTLGPPVTGESRGFDSDFCAGVSIGSGGVRRSG
jgi:hypothetical protein